MKIKICGLKRKEDVDYVNRWRPDYVGFVFAGTKRRIDYETAAILKANLDKSIKAVGVFVNADMSTIERLVQDSVIDIIQLHGDEDEDYIVQLRKRLIMVNCRETPVVKAVRVQNAGQVLEAEQLPVDALLLDAFSESEYGGSGKVFNHTNIPKLTKPYMLAGGIGCENVIEILKGIEEKNVTLPFCVDVSSSVETDGYKDEEKIKAMISVVKQWNALK